MKTVADPCAKCGSVERYVGGACKACSKASMLRSAARRLSAHDPCSKCGSVDLYATGVCKACNKAWRDQAAEKRLASGEPCAKCGLVDRLASGKCRPCRNENERVRAAKRVAEGKPCDRCGGTARKRDGGCRPCSLRQHHARGARKMASAEPCTKCGGTERMPGSGGACKTCRTEWQKKKASSGDPCKACGGTARWSSGQCKACGTSRLRRYKYGIDAKEIGALRAAQGDKCASCKCPLSRLHSTHVHVDHDHNTGSVRGVLCRGCNLAIGFLRDSPSNAEAVARYLRAHAPSLPFTKGAA